MKFCMDEASQAVQGDGYVLKSDLEAVHWPGRYMHEDGARMWQRIEAAVEAAEKRARSGRTFAKDPAVPVVG